MTLKKYTSKSIVSILAKISDKRSAYISFMPVVDVGGVFVTTEEVLQTALENHPEYGRLFTLHSSEESSKDITEPTPSYYSKDSGSTPSPSPEPGTQPGPNTVGTDEIIDGSIQIRDMNPNTMAKSGDIDNIFNE